MLECGWQDIEAMSSEEDKERGVQFPVQAGTLSWIHAQQRKG